MSREKNKKETSWESVNEWYGKVVGDKGHFYHQKVIWPQLLPLLDLKAFEKPKLVDFACGTGVFSQQLPATLEYHGVDLSRGLLSQAKQGKNRFYQQADICKPLKLSGFSHATCILALQNLEDPAAFFKNVSNALVNGGIFVCVMNHPCFRIPRQSHWGIDEKQNLQYRRMDRYLSPMKIPIQATPSKGENSEKTWSFHFPLSFYINGLSNENLVTTGIHEWICPKKSLGGQARRENRARTEFPLFLAIKFKKLLI